MSKLPAAHASKIWGLESPHVTVLMFTARVPVDAGIISVKNPSALYRPNGSSTLGRGFLMTSYMLSSYQQMQVKTG